MLKKIKTDRKYFIINVDEPYAEAIYNILKVGQTAKGQWPEGDISFEEWKKLTFEDEPALSWCTCKGRDKFGTVNVAECVYHDNLLCTHPGGEDG